jgi:hypothetical protein
VERIGEGSGGTWSAKQNQGDKGRGEDGDDNEMRMGQSSRVRGWTRGGDKVWDVSGSGKR